MIFEIIRTTRWSNDKTNPPIEGAIFVEKDDSEFWSKDFDTIDDILELIDKEGDEIVIGNVTWDPYCVHPKYFIEIYDDYRE